MRRGGDEETGRRRRFNDLILSRLSVKRHPRPAQLLGSLAHIPVGLQQGAEDALALALRRLICFRELATERLGQVLDGDLLGGEIDQVDENGFDEILDFAHIAGPRITEQAG